MLDVPKAIDAEFKAQEASHYNGISHHAERDLLVVRMIKNSGEGVDVKSEQLVSFFKASDKSLIKTFKWDHITTLNELFFGYKGNLMIGFNEFQVIIFDVSDTENVTSHIEELSQFPGIEHPHHFSCMGTDLLLSSGYKLSVISFDAPIC